MWDKYTTKCAQWAKLNVQYKNDLVNLDWREWPALAAKYAADSIPLLIELHDLERELGLQFPTPQMRETFREVAITH
jgi:hypothetical protein